MTTLEGSLGIYWALMAVMSVALAIYRAPLARRLRPQMRYWRNRADAQRLYERSMLVVGIGVAVISLTAMYGAVVVLPALDRTLAQMKPRTEVSGQAAWRRNQDIEPHVVAAGVEHDRPSTP